MEGKRKGRKRTIEEGGEYPSAVRAWRSRKPTGDMTAWGKFSGKDSVQQKLKGILPAKRNYPAKPTCGARHRRILTLQAKKHIAKVQRQRHDEFTKEAKNPLRNKSPISLEEKKGRVLRPFGGKT